MSKLYLQGDVNQAIYTWSLDKLHSNRLKTEKQLLFLLLWLQFLSNNIPGLGVKVLAYKYIKLNYEMFEDCHN